MQPFQLLLCVLLSVLDLSKRPTCLQGAGFLLLALTHPLCLGGGDSRIICTELLSCYFTSFLVANFRVKAQWCQTSSDSSGILISWLRWKRAIRAHLFWRAGCDEDSSPTRASSGVGSEVAFGAFAARAACTAWYLEHHLWGCRCVALGAQTQGAKAVWSILPTHRALLWCVDAS